ncbi:hypothetical protein Pmani_003682 [Petrolisthes manimaculis]|uniref:Uncharacterized protein n=1 Tax=Petrolisthes manimaculis TaxID=1843537 RepID=A0AAE1QFT0_9EUCA|nr:hypothetical protein Pmani_003682 [Petrolisthes manimaculis]
MSTDEEGETTFLYKRIPSSVILPATPKVSPAILVDTAEKHSSESPPLTARKLRRPSDWGECRGFPFPNIISSPCQEKINPWT